MTSRDEIAGRWNGEFGTGGTSSSSDVEIMRGVAFSVPHVINCLTAAEPSSEGVGDGIVGTRENAPVGDLG
jgi:hypothetical protein